MDLQNQHSSSTDLSLVQPVEQTQVKNFMANVFAYMFMALAISALFAYLFATNLSLLQYLISSTGRGLSALGYIVMLAVSPRTEEYSYAQDRSPRLPRRHRRWRSRLVETEVLKPFKQ